MRKSYHKFSDRFDCERSNQGVEIKKAPGIKLDEDDIIFVQTYKNKKIAESQYTLVNFPSEEKPTQAIYLHVFNQIKHYLKQVIKKPLLSQISSKLIHEFLKNIKNNQVNIIVIKNVRKYKACQNSNIDDNKQALALGFKLANTSKKYVYSIAEQYDDCINIYITEGLICLNNIPAITENLFYSWRALAHKMHHTEGVHAEMILASPPAHTPDISQLKQVILTDAVEDKDYQYLSQLLNYHPSDPHNHFRDYVAKSLTQIGIIGQQSLIQQLILDNDIDFINHLREKRQHDLALVTICARQAYKKIIAQHHEIQDILLNRAKRPQKMMSGIGHSNYTLALVSGNKEQAEYFKKCLKEIKFPNNFNIIICISNPSKDINIGSGGAQIKAFISIVKSIYERKKRQALNAQTHYQVSTIADILKGEKMIIVPSGGDSQRNIFHTLNGKAFDKFSHLQNNGKPLTVFDNVMYFIYDIFQQTQRQFKNFDDINMMVTIPGDTDLIVDLKTFDFKKLNENFVIGLAVLLSPREASNHGVFILDIMKDQRLNIDSNKAFAVKNFLQKPSIESMHNHGAIYHNPKLGMLVAADSGLFMAGEKTIMTFARLTGLCDLQNKIHIEKLEQLFSELEQEQLDHKKYLLRDHQRTGIPGWDQSEIEFYDDIFCAFQFSQRSSEMLENWIKKPVIDVNNKLNIIKTEARILLRRYLTKHLGTIPFSVIVSSKCQFVDLGLMSKDLEVKTRRNDIYNTDRIFKSYIDIGACVNESSIYLSLIGAQVQAQDNTFISESLILGKCNLAAGSAIARVHLKTEAQFNLTAGTVAIGWHFIDPVDKISKSTIVLLHNQDNPKSRMIFGEALSQYIEKKGIEPRALWDDILKENRTQWNARLYVVGEMAATLNQYLQIGMKMTKPIYNAWKNSARVSLQTLKQYGDYNAIINWANFLNQQIQKNNQVIQNTGGELSCLIREKWRVLLNKDLKPHLALKYNPCTQVKSFYRSYVYSHRPIVVLLNLAKAAAIDQNIALNRPSSKKIGDVLLAQSPESMSFARLQLNPQQRLCTKQIIGKEYQFITNIFPLFSNTFLRINTQISQSTIFDDPQFLSYEYLESSLTIISNNPSLRLWFNSMGAAASINSLHEQGVAFRAFPIEQEPGVLFAHSTYAHKHTTTQISILEHFPSQGISFRSHDKHSLIDVAYHFVQMLQIKNIGHNLFNYYDRLKKELVVIIFVRSGKTDNFALGNNLASPELSGLMTINSQNKLKDLINDPTLIFKAMNENILPLPQVRLLLKEFVTTVHRKSIGHRSIDKENFSNESLITLVEHLEKNHHQIRKKLIEAMAWNHINLIKNKLIEICLDESINEEKKLGACFALSLIGTQSGLDTLEALYQNPTRPALRQASIRATINIGGSQAIGLLIKALQDPWWSIQIDATLGLGKIAKPEALKVDCYLLNKNKRVTIRHQVILALRQRLLSNQNPLIQRAAAISLAEMGLNLVHEHETILALMKLAQNKTTHWQAKLETLKTLADLPFKTLESEPRLKHCLKALFEQILVSSDFQSRQNLGETLATKRLFDWNIQQDKTNQISIYVDLQQFEQNILMQQTLKEAEKIKQDNVVKMIWERNARYHWDNPLGQSERLRSRTFEYLPLIMLDMIDSYRQIGEHVRARIKDKKIDYIINIGIGGSSFGSYIYRELIETCEIKQLFILDASHPQEVIHILENIDLEHSIVVYSSKGGASITPRASFKCIYTYFEQKLKKNPKDHFIIITDKHAKLSQLYDEAKQLELLIVPTIDNVSGRYSVLSTETLFIPAAFSKCSVIKLILKNTIEHAMPKASPLTPVLQSPSVLLAGFLNSMYKSKRYIMTIFASSKLTELKRWCEMLIAENLGKDGVGFIPIVDEKIQAKYPKNRCFLILAIEEDNTIHNQISLLKKQNLPVFVINIPQNNPINYIGELFYTIEWATVITGYYMGVDTFIEPAFHGLKLQVEKALQTIKINKEAPSLNTKNNISKERFNQTEFILDYSRVFELGENGITHAALNKLMIKLNTDNSNLAAMYASILFLLKNNCSKEYTALLPYLYKGNNESDNPLYLAHGPYQKWVKTMSTLLNVATIVREGPRFQHWLYPLFAMGPNTGIFTIIYENHIQEDVLVTSITKNMNIEDNMTLAQITKGKAIGSANDLYSKGKPVLLLSSENFEVDALTKFFNQVTYYLKGLIITLSS